MARSAVESFFKSPLSAIAAQSFAGQWKAELVWRRNWQTRREVKIALFEDINGFYNPRRKHSALGWESPLAFEQRTAEHEYLTGTKPVQVQIGLPLAPLLNRFGKPVLTHTWRPHPMRPAATSMRASRTIGCPV